VGKLLKRELVYDAARREFASALEKNGIDQRSLELRVSAGSDGRLTANVKLPADKASLKNRIQQVLAPYTIGMEVDVAGSVSSVTR
jgi:hypothetical protein